jgi:broad specificity phosphatase PhoE
MIVLSWRPPEEVGMDLIAIRHGMVEERFRGRFIGVTDAPLSEQGREEARRLAAALAGLRPQRVCVSPLQRARDTAGMVSAPWGVTPQVVEALHELDMGTLEGAHPQDMRTLAPGFYEEWRHDLSRVRFPQGESMPALVERVAGWVDALRAEEGPPDRTVVAVTHLFVIFGLLHHLTGIPLDVLRKTWLTTGSATRWTLGERPREDRLVLLNWTPAPFPIPAG